MVKRKTFATLVATAVWILVIAIAAYLPSEAKYGPLLDLLEFLMFIIPAAGFLYLVNLAVRARHDPELKVKVERATSASKVLRPIGWIAFIWLLCAGIFAVWQFYAARRTATVREVFLHGASSDLGPQVYMDDGTVWSLDDAPERVLMIKGDKVRYKFVAIPSATMDSSSPNACELDDITTGYVSEAIRLSAPFKRSSCPAD